jgi:hypothetical protein
MKSIIKNKYKRYFKNNKYHCFYSYDASYLLLQENTWHDKKENKYFQDKCHGYTKYDDDYYYFNNKEFKL